MNRANLWNGFDRSPGIFINAYHDSVKDSVAPSSPHRCCDLYVYICVGRNIKRDNGAKKSCFHGNTYRCVSGWQRDWSSWIQRRCLMHRTQKQANIQRAYICEGNSIYTHTAKLQCICYIVQTFTTWLQFVEWMHLCLTKSRKRNTCWFI